MRMTLGTKIVLVLFLFALILSGVSIATSSSVIQSMNDAHFMDRADEIADTLARVLDADDLATLRAKTEEVLASTDERVMSDDWGSPEFDHYTELFADIAETDEYERVLEQLRNLQEVNNVNCLYTSFVDAEDELFVYLVDADTGEPCPIGCLDPIYDMNRDVLKDPAVGFPAYITNTEEYGWLVTACRPVFDEAGEVVCYACADISMDAIRQRQEQYVTSLALSLGAITLMLALAVAIVTRLFVSQPLNTLAKAAVSYSASKEGGSTSFENLHISTKDEIEDLHKSMVQMEHDIDSHIEDLVTTRTELEVAKREADLLSDLARTDALTGVRNKLAYEQEIGELQARLDNGLTSFGIAVADLNDLKPMNDTYGHECGDEYISTLSGIICNTYDHSPVFRIGGDEFCIILTGRDFEHAQELEDSFYATIDELRNDTTLEPWQRASAALGYAHFDPSLDDDVTSVFRRADEDMYEHKRQMKGNVR